MLKYVCGYIVVINLIINLFKWLVLGYEVLCYIVWLGKNCSLFVCVLSFCGLSICFELCSVDLFVNLYLVMVVLFKVGLFGIKDELIFLVLVDCNIYGMNEEECEVIGIYDLLESLGYVLIEFEKDDIIKVGLGEYIFEYFIEVKIIECDMFCIVVYFWECE